MLCTCSGGEQFRFKEAPPNSPESLATRDFSASGNRETKAAHIQVDEAESTLKEALSLNYEEARALLGRLEYEKGNLDAAVQVFQGIDVNGLTPRMIKAIFERTRPRNPHSKDDIIPSGVMSLHSVSLLLEAFLLKAKSLEKLGHCREAAKECTIIIDIVESALPNGMPSGITQDCKLQYIFHNALDLLPYMWIKACLLNEAITAYRRVLFKQWNLHPERLASVQKELAALLIYGGVEACFPTRLDVYGPNVPKNNTEEAVLLLLLLMQKVADGIIKWDEEIMDHLTYALSCTSQFQLLADHVEQALPGSYSRAERWYFLALCYSAADQNEVALNLLKKVSGSSEAKNKPHIPSLLLGAKLCSQDPKHANEGIEFARKVINLTDYQHRHSTVSAYKFLGTCYGTAARVSILKSERVSLQNESLNMLNCAALNGKEDPELMLALALENAVQRNLDVAFDNALNFSQSADGNTERGWKLLALLLSAEQRYKEAENIVECSLEEASRMDHLELLRLKATIQMAQQQPKYAIETYKILLTHIQAQRDLQAKNSYYQAPTFELEALAERKLELAAWQDLAEIYIKLGIWSEAEVSIEKAKLMEFYSSRSWHTAGLAYEAKLLHKEALSCFSVSLFIEPDYVPSIVSTAEVLMKLGKQTFPIARSFLMSALKLEPTNDEAWMKLGLMSKLEGLLDQASDYFQAAYVLKQSAPVENFI